MVDKSRRSRAKYSRIGKPPVKPRRVNLHEGRLAALAVATASHPGPAHRLGDALADRSCSRSGALVRAAGRPAQQCKVARRARGAGPVAASRCSGAIGMEIWRFGSPPRRSSHGALRVDDLALVIDSRSAPSPRIAAVLLAFLALEGPAYRRSG